MEKMRSDISAGRYQIVTVLLLIYILSIITHRDISQTYEAWNDQGYHAHMAQLIQNNLFLPTLDPQWRGGILVNYPTIWPLTLATVSAITSKEIWDIYPFTLMIIWSLFPCTIFYLVYSVTGKYVHSILAAGFALFPITNPDQGALICALIISPICILYFLKLIKNPNTKTSVLFGLLCGLLFHSHLLTFQFLVITFALTTILWLMYTSVSKEVCPISIVRQLLISSVIFAVCTIHWWIISFQHLGTSMLKTPLTGLSEEISSRVTWLWLDLYGSEQIASKAIFIAIIIVIITLINLKRLLKSYYLETIYLITFSVLALMFYHPTELIRSLSAVPWRYSVFIYMSSIIISGITTAYILETVLTRMQNKKLIAKTASIYASCVLVIIILSVYAYFQTSRISISDAETGGMGSGPIPKAGAYKKAMRWLDSQTNLKSVVAARTAQSSLLLYFTKARTLGGHYGGFNPDTARDKASNTILYSPDIEATKAAIKKYDVSHIFVDMANEGGATFEDSVRWHDTYRKHYNLTKLIPAFELIYDKDDILIFKTSPNSKNIEWNNLPSNVRQYSHNTISENFEDLNEWPLSAPDIEEKNWKHEINNGVVTLSLNSVDPDREEEVYARRKLSEQEQIKIGRENETILKVRYRVSDPLTRLNIVFKLKGKDSVTVMLDSTEWHEEYVLLGRKAEGVLEEIQWGIWETGLKNGKHFVEVDYITVK